MKKQKKAKIRKLAADASDREIVRWASENDLFERLQSGVSEIVEDHSDLDELLDEAIWEKNTTQLNIRIPPAMKAMLSRLAKERTTDAGTLGRIWLAERIRKELSSRRKPA